MNGGQERTKENITDAPVSKGQTIDLQITDNVHSEADHLVHRGITPTTSTEGIIITATDAAKRATSGESVRYS